MNKEEDYSIMYPELTEFGKAKTKLVVDKFAKQLEDLTNNTFVEFTNIIADEIVDDDAWIDLRHKVITALCGYTDRDRENKKAGGYLGQNWVTIRQQILNENKEAIYDDIIKDKDYEIEQLKQTIEIMNRREY